MPKKLMSEREFARKMGASLSSVQRRREAGRLPKSASTGPKGERLIDPGLGREEWDRCAPVSITPAGSPTPDVTGSLEEYQIARTRREAALASLAEDELRKSRGELVEAAGVHERLVTLFTNARTKVLGVPSKARQQLPSLTRAYLAVIEDLLREALEGLADGDE